MNDDGDNWNQPGQNYQHHDGDGLNPDVAAAIAQIDGALTTLIEIGDRGGLATRGPAGLIAAARAFETLRSRMSGVDAHIVHAAEATALPAYASERTVPSALASVLRIAPSTARARVRLAAAITPVQQPSGAITEPVLPVLADAVREGTVTVDQAAVILPELENIRTNPELSIEQLAHAEEVLVDHAATFGPRALRQIAAKIDDTLLPDGVLPDDRITQARRGLVIGPQRRDGTHSITGLLTTSLATKLTTALGPLAAPRPADDAMGRDERTSEQRTHDALDDLLSRLLDTLGLPRSGGTPATVHLNIDLDKLQRQLDAIAEQSGHVTGPGKTTGLGVASGLGGRGEANGPSSLGEPGESGKTGVSGEARGSAGLQVSGPSFEPSPARGGKCLTVGTTADGSRLTLAELRRLAGNADLVPVWTKMKGGVLNYGRTRRIATPNQTNALITRDKGCSFPDCDAPPDWCQRHHVIDWLFGGETDINNLTLVCGYHHREFENAGWHVVIQGGWPVWIPPARTDPNRTPRMNLRITGGTMPNIDTTEAHAIARANHAIRHSGRLGARKSNAGTDADGNPVAADASIDAEPLDTEPLDTEPLDTEPLDPIDDLTVLISQHIDPERRNDFQRALTKLLHNHGATTDTHPPTLDRIAR